MPKYTGTYFQITSRQYWKLILQKTLIHTYTIPTTDCKGGAGTCGLDGSWGQAWPFQDSTVTDWLIQIMKPYSLIIVGLKNNVPIESRAFCRLSSYEVELPDSPCACFLWVSLEEHDREVTDGVDVFWNIFTHLPLGTDILYSSSMRIHSNSHKNAC